MRKCGNMCLYRRALTGVFAVLLAVEISACGGKAKPGQETGVSQKAEITQEKASAPVWKDMRPERSMELSYAKQFSVDYYDGGYDLIQVQDDSTCLVVPEGAAVPEGLPTTVTIVLALGGASSLDYCFAKTVGSCVPGSDIGYGPDRGPGPCGPDHAVRNEGVRMVCGCGQTGYGRWDTILCGKIQRTGL